MKKYIIAFLSVSLLASCTKDLTSLNEDIKNPSSVPSYSLFTSAQRELMSNLTTSDVNTNVFRLITQQWQETTYTDESNYDFSTRPIPDNIWNHLYRDVLIDLESSKKLIPTDVSDATVQKNQLAVLDIMEVCTWYYLVTTYGNIPYTEALNPDLLFPKYDDAKTIQDDLFTRINADIATLSTGGSSFDGADIIFNGDVASWKKFANSFKLKMAMTIADSDNAQAKTAAEEAVASGVFTANTDNASFEFSSSTPNTNPVWLDQIQGGRTDFVAATTLTTQMNTLSDPRRPYYFTVDDKNAYSGGSIGAPSSFARFSKPVFAKVSASDPATTFLGVPNAPALLMDYSEVEFCLAEAAARGYAVGGTAAEHYTKAIVGSMAYWMGVTETVAATTPSVVAYLAQVNYATTPGTYKQKIGLQKWLALYNRGWDAWIDIRKFDYPAMAVPIDFLSGYPNRLTYPVKEQNVNVVNFKAASDAIGGNTVETKLYWDKF
ncbi:SusD/RagB family nutrient-binding outer membrane lipoprotein [Arcticibacter svalbardensis]|nr:SusD/RagB family nutrient-binding outer membrane lipoprotein [Arcticibacter svalbardensis]